jgi:cation diffusion facilitator CzcD-associated flavoprotein CzcO
MVDELDVAIVGAGLSGIGAAYRLKTSCPGRRFTLLEARDAIGGTWDLFRFPGVRSDSDMATLGYPFAPWREGTRAAPGASILAYVRETAARFGIDREIRFRHRVVAARWSSEEGRWTLEVEAGVERRPVQLRCRFLYLCTGYYAYDAAHEAGIPGAEAFRGRIVHPQWWPKDLDYSSRRVVVIGSGATAVTLVPAMSGRAAHVTMVQRSPSYIGVLPGRDRVDALRGFLPRRLADRLIRARNILLGILGYVFCRRFPRVARRVFLKQARQHLPPGYPVELHFQPRYEPWDQRLCLAPDGDLFAAISAGRVTMVTGTIERFTERGLRLSSGAELDADVVVTATGLKLLAFGGISLEVDGRRVESGEAVIYRGAMLSGMPNLAWCMGYTNASWTLRADLSSRFVCRLLKYMDRHGHDIAVPRLGAEPQQLQPLMNLTSGYVARAAHQMPRRGSRGPWAIQQNYLLDLWAMATGRVDEPSMSFSATARPAGTSAPSPPATR